MTEVEIGVLIYAMGLKVQTDKIPDYLLCAINANWIAKHRSGVEEYFCALPNLNQAIEYKLRKELPAEEKDRDRWRARVIDYWRANDTNRFSSIQIVLEGAL